MDIETISGVKEDEPVAAEQDEMVANDKASEENSQPVDSESSDEEQIEREFDKLIKGGKYSNAFRKRLQKILNGRLKNLESLESYKAGVEPLITKLANALSIDNRDDIDVLSEKLNTFIDKLSKGDEKPNDNGQDSTTNTAESIDCDAIMSVVDDNLTQSGIAAIYDAWLNEAQLVKKLYPDFDVETELDNHVFAEMIRRGVPMLYAYRSLHHDDIVNMATQSAASSVAEKLGKSIAFSSSRPDENGNGGRAGVVTKSNVSNMTGDDIRRVIKEVAQGKKISF